MLLSLQLRGVHWTPAPFEKALSAHSAKLYPVSKRDDGDNVFHSGTALKNIDTFDTVCHAAPLVSFQRETFLPSWVRLF